MNWLSIELILFSEEWVVERMSAVYQMSQHQKHRESGSLPCQDLMNDKSAN